MSSGGGGGGSGGEQESAEARELYRVQADISRQMWDQHKQLGSPVMAQLAEDALAGSSDGRRQERVGQAGADVTQAFAAERDSTNRQLTGMGVNPASGRFVGTNRAMGMAEAGTKAGAMTRARRGLDAEDYGRKLDLVGITTGQGAQAQQGISNAASGMQGIANTKAQQKASHQQSQGALLGAGLSAAGMAF